MPKEPTPIATRAALRSVPSTAEATPRVRTRDESTVTTKPDDDATGTPDFYLGKVMVDVAFHERRFDRLETKVDAIAKQNEALSTQTQRVAALMLGIVASTIADAAGAGGSTKSVALVAALVVLLAFPQAAGLLVGRIPALAALLPAPQGGAQAKPSTPPPKEPPGPLSAA